jgi:hypothetical protein
VRVRIGFTNIEVLSFLKGQPWDDVARAYVHGLRPSEVRVSTGTLKSNAVLWRVTVMMNDKALITEITQEVEVLLPPDIENGHSLRCEMDRRGVVTP